MPGEIAVEPLQEATVCRTEIDRVQLRLAKADGAGALVVLPIAVPACARHVNALVEENLGEEHLVLEKTSERLVEAPETLIALPADHEAARVGRRLVSYERNDERRRGDDGVERDGRIEEVIGGPGPRIAGPAVPPLGPAVDHAHLWMARENGHLLGSLAGSQTSSASRKAMSSPLDTSTPRFRDALIPRLTLPGCVT